MEVCLLSIQVLLQFIQCYNDSWSCGNQCFDMCVSSGIQIEPKQSLPPRLESPRGQKTII